MKNALSALCVGLLYLFCGLAKAQNSVPSVKIISVKAQYTSKDSALILVDSLQKQPASLSYDQNYLLFRFVNKQDSSQKSFSYKLKGLDYEWITCNNCKIFNIFCDHTIHSNNSMMPYLHTIFYTNMST